MLVEGKFDPPPVNLEELDWTPVSLVIESPLTDNGELLVTDPLPEATELHLIGCNNLPSNCAECPDGECTWPSVS